MHLWQEKLYMIMQIISTSILFYGIQNLNRVQLDG